MKFAVYQNPEQADAVVQRLKGFALEDEYQMAVVRSEETKIHLVDRLFCRIARDIDWEGLADRFLRFVLQKEGLRLPAGDQPTLLHQLAQANQRDETTLRNDVRTALELVILNDDQMTEEFRRGMLQLCRSRLEGEGQHLSLGLAVREWLQGECRLISGLRGAAIYQKVARHNARICCFH